MAAKRRLEIITSLQDHYASGPSIYKGLIHTEVIERIRNIAGRAIGSITPDVYSAIAILSVVELYYRIGIPVSLGGLSRASQGVSQLSANAGREVTKEFMERNSLPFHPDIPYMPMLMALQAEAALQARDAGLISGAQIASYKHMLDTFYFAFRRMSPDLRETTAPALQEFARKHGMEQRLRQWQTRFRAKSIVREPQFGLTPKVDRVSNVAFVPLRNVGVVDIQGACAVCEILARSLERTNTGESLIRIVRRIPSALRTLLLRHCDMLVLETLRQKFRKLPDKDGIEENVAK
jgi:hypothetical protein